MVFFTKNSQFLIFLSAYNNLALRLKLEIINPIVSTLLPSLQDYWLAGFTDADVRRAGRMFYFIFTI